MSSHREAIPVALQIRGYAEAWMTDLRTSIADDQLWRRLVDRGQRPAADPPGVVAHLLAGDLGL